MAKIKKAQFGAPVRKGCYRGGCAATTSGADRAERREARQAERDYRKAIRVSNREERQAARAERKAPKAQAGMKASNKRVGPVDPQGAWTKVQEQTIAGKRTPVSLTRDKQLGATKMAKKGVKVKAKDGKWIQKAINPKHKGYCTPMTKKTCTPKRKALAVTLKKMAKSRKGK